MPSPSDIEEIASNINDEQKTWRYGIVQIISALSNLIKTNMRVVLLVVLVVAKILTKENIVAFFNAIKGFEVTLGFGG